jgi:ribosomal protein S3
MATQYHESGQLPEGVVLAHTLHGRVDQTITHAHTAGHLGVEVVQAPYDGIPYYEDANEPTVALVVPQELDELPKPRAEGREKRCTAKDDTCMGWAIGGHDLCAAHAGVFKRTTPAE